MSPSLPPEQPGTGPTIFARLRSPTGLAVTILCGVTLAFYHGLWMPGLALVKRDAFRSFPQIKTHIIERLASGELPQWFPYEALGRPLIGATAIGVFHPFTALYFLLPPYDAYRASALACCLLAAIGAFVLGRRLSCSPAGALLAGLALALSGYVVSLTDNIQYLYAICLLPLFCAALEKALRDGLAWVVAAAALWATVFLHGDIQTGYYFGFVALAWTAARAPGSYREAGLRLGLAGALAALLAGVQLAPAAAVLVGSDRTRPALFHEDALLFSTHPLRLATILASPVGEKEDPVVVARGFFGNPRGGVEAESLYLGIPVTGLALLGALRRRDLRVLALIGGIALVLALGRYGGLYDLFYRAVPLWSAFRYPEKLMGFVAFAAAMLAGAGFDALRAGHGRLPPWLLAALLCAGAGLALRTDAAGAWAAAHFDAPAAVAGAVTGSAGRALLYSAVGALGVWLILAAARRGYLRQTPALGALTAIVVLDLARANLGAYHTGPAEAATFTPPFVEALRSREGPLAPGRFRVVSIAEETIVWPQEHMAVLGYYGAASVARRQALDLEHNAEFRLETVMPYLPGYSSQFAEALNESSGIEAAARLNVTYFIGRRYHLQDPRLARGLVAQFPAYDLALFRNPVRPKPRAYLSLKPEPAASPVAPAALLARPDFLDGTVDVIETVGASLPGPAAGGTASIDRYEPESVRVSVDTPQPAVLVLLDAYDKGWTATLDGNTVLPILRANALVRAVVVPAGTHAVTFAYRTPLLQAGAWISAWGILLCIGLIARTRRRSAGRQPD